MKFTCKTEPYRHFRGILFQNYLPTDVRDKATIEALMSHPDFEAEKEPETTKAEKPKMPDVCPKCGRVVKRGKYIHQTYCKGK